MKHRTLRLSALAGIRIFLVVFSTGIHSASFNCQKAMSVSERLICDDAELSKLDDEAALAYKEALRNSANPKEVVASQRDAWRQREKECSSKACLIEWFAQRKSSLNAALQTSSPPHPASYLPWTLDVAGYQSGKCQVTELARSFKEARGWASESSGWINVHGVNESPEKITFSYYDGLIKAESIRTFYKDMKTCKDFRQ